MNSFPKAQLTADFCRAIAEVRYKLKRMLQQKLKDAGIDLSFEVLEVISILIKHQNINQQLLADMLSREKSSMTYVLENMVKSGLITRREKDGDRRNKLITLTTHALHLKEKVTPLATECFALISQQLSEEQLETGMHVCNQMNNSLDNFLSL